MSAVEFDHGKCSEKNKVQEEDLSSNSADSSNSKQRHDTEILFKTEPNSDVENNTNSKRNIKDIPNYSIHPSQPEENHLSENIISGNVSSTVTSRKNKSQRGSDYFDLQRQGSNILEKIITKNFSDKKFIKILNLLGVLSHLKQHSYKTEPFREIISSCYQRITSNALKDESRSKFHLGCSGHPPSTKLPNHHNDMEKLSCDVSSIFNEKQSVSEINIINEESGLKCQLILLCFFDPNAGFRDMNSKPMEDIKIVLPLTFNTSVTSNVVTITNKSNQNINIFFRNPVITKIEKCCMLSHATKTANISENNRDVHNKQLRNMNFPQGETSLSSNTQSFSITEEKNENFDESKNIRNQLSKTKTNFFPLHDPLLLKYTDGKKTKQILMYKDHSLRGLPDNVSGQKFYKTIENLLTTSNQYEGDPIHFIFDPLKVIHKLKRERKGGGNLVHVHSSEAKHDLRREHSFSSNNDNHTEARNLYKLIKRKKAFITTSKTSFVTCLDTECYRNGFLSNSSNTSSKTNLQSSNFTKQTKYATVVSSNDEHLISNDKNRQEKLMLKFLRRKKSWTSYKRVDVRKIVSSVFRDFFHFYSLLGGNLRSGSVITKSNSNFWLRVSGVATDSCTLKLATDLFTSVAGTKVVLNIYDYLKFLIAFAQRRRLIVAELVKQMMACDRSIPLSVLEQKRSTRRSKIKNQRNKSTNVCERHFEIHWKCRSLPDLRNI